MDKRTGSYSRVKARLEEQENYMDLKEKIMEAIKICTLNNMPEEANQWLGFYDNIKERIEE